MNNRQRIPKKVWFYWDAGLDTAPAIVKICHDSWVKFNPDWEVNFLDERSIKQYIDFESEFGDIIGKLPIQKRANLYRLCLLSQRGGVWADATCLCVSSLNDWIYRYVETGFFAFRDPGKDRLLANWFLVAEVACPLIDSFYEAHKRYWETNDFPGKKSNVTERNVTERILSVLLNTNSKRTEFWFSWFVRKIIKIYPYFIFHYHFAYHIRRHVESYKIFFNMPFYDAAIPLRLFRHIRKGTSLQRIREAIRIEACPVHKLCWKSEFFNDTDARLEGKLLAMFPSIERILH